MFRECKRLTSSLCFQTINSFSISGCELTLESANNFPLNKDADANSQEDVNEPSKAQFGEIRMSFGPDQLTFTEFVQEGWRRASQPINLHVPNDWFQQKANAILWQPDSSLINNDDNSDTTNDKCFYLDGESVDIRGPMEVSILPQKIVLFCGQDLAKDLKNSDTNNSSNDRKWWQRTTTISRR